MAKSTPVGSHYEAQFHRGTAVLGCILLLDGCGHNVMEDSRAPGVSMMGLQGCTSAGHTGESSQVATAFSALCG